MLPHADAADAPSGLLGEGLDVPFDVGVSIPRRPVAQTQRDVQLIRAFHRAFFGQVATGPIQRSPELLDPTVRI